jgi:hypothetical protein
MRLRLLIAAVALLGVAAAARAQLPNNTSNSTLTNLSYNAGSLFAGLQQVFGGPSYMITGLIVLAIFGLLLLRYGQGLDLLVAFAVPMVFLFAIHGFLPAFLAYIVGGAAFFFFVWGMVNTLGATR